MTPRSPWPPRESISWLVVAAVVWLLAAVFWPTPGPIPPGDFEGQAVIVTEVTRGRYGPWALAEGEFGTLLLRLGDDTSLQSGDVVELTGSVGGKPGWTSGKRYRGVLKVQAIEKVGSQQNLARNVGRGVRSHVMERLQPLDEGRALLAGFLIGETSALSDHDVEAMRKSGLAHFVAVSGSNVALVLMLVFIAAGPLSLGPKRRAVVGLSALPVYAAATKFEPSVMRASVMAGIALGGRLVGIVLDPWQLLAAAVILLLAFDPFLVASVGFQMSVAATAGVMVGARWPIAAGILRRALAVTVGAQLAVAPLLLVHFDGVPLLSPVANLVAAPLVTASTLLGAVGVVVPGPFVNWASVLAEMVLAIARGASSWPQLDPLGFATLAGCGVVVWRWPATRAPAVIVGGAGLVLLLIAPPRPLPDPAAVVLDVGQGDAILLHSADRYVLVDGGPDQLLLVEKLNSYGVRNIDLVVLTHVHADHATGLSGLMGRFGVGRVWADLQPHSSSASAELIAAAESHGVPIETPEVGHTVSIGALSLTLEGPVRRYASPNDQSVVLTVTGPARSMLLSGDIETFAQSDLDHLRADVLKVPHQGGATSDPAWLATVGASLAVISVGPNQFGHPAAWVIDVLEESGAEVVRTDQAGDVIVPLG